VLRVIHRRHEAQLEMDTILKQRGREGGSEWTSPQSMIPIKYSKAKNIAPLRAVAVAGPAGPTSRDGDATGTSIDESTTPSSCTRSAKRIHGDREVSSSTAKAQGTSRADRKASRDTAARACSGAPARPAWDNGA
jgi:hypothetical protein